MTVPTTHRRAPLPFQTVAIITILSLFGFTLILQSSRWHNTPAYGNLLDIMSANVWGGIYLFAAALIFVGLMTHRFLSIAGHTVAFVLLSVWWVAFVIRFFTDDRTTVVNVVSWATYLALLVWSARVINDRYIFT